MRNKRIKRKTTFKQMAFETAVRNPERYLGILKIISRWEGKILNDSLLLEIVSTLYLEKIVSSNKIKITEETAIEDIKDLVIEVNSSRRADGGFPSGYASRFWTYMRTPSELGFVYARYREKLFISPIVKMLIKGEIDEQEAFSIQAMKFNRRNPYRNVKNDFNFFRFILEVILRLRESGKILSFEQFVVAMFSRNGDVVEFLRILENNTFNTLEDCYSFVKSKYGVKTRFKTVVQDYPDVVRRLLLISGFITVIYRGRKFIQLNENKF